MHGLPAYGRQAASIFCPTQGCPNVKTYRAPVLCAMLDILSPWLSSRWRVPASAASPHLGDNGLDGVKVQPVIPHQGNGPPANGRRHGQAGNGRGHQQLHIPHAELLGHGLPGNGHAPGPVRQLGQRPGIALGQVLLHEEGAQLRLQAGQAELLGHQGGGLAQAAGQLLLGEAILGEPVADVRLLQAMVRV